MENTVILLGKGIDGAYFVASGTEESMNKAAENLKTLSVDSFKVVSIENGYELDELRENAQLFKEVYADKKLENLERSGTEDGLNKTETWGETDTLGENTGVETSAGTDTGMGADTDTGADTGTGADSFEDDIFANMPDEVDLSKKPENTERFIDPDEDLFGPEEDLFN